MYNAQAIAQWGLRTACTLSTAWWFVKAKNNCPNCVNGDIYGIFRKRTGVKCENLDSGGSLKSYSCVSFMLRDQQCWDDSDTRWCRNVMHETSSKQVTVASPHLPRSARTNMTQLLSIIHSQFYLYIIVKLTGGRRASIYIQCTLSVTQRGRVNAGHVIDW